MAIVVCKGTILKHTVSSSLVAVAQIMSIDHSGAESTSFENKTLDGGAAIPHTPTGYSEGGTVDFEIFMDPALAGHQSITDRITDPVLTTADRLWQISFKDAAVTTANFTMAGTGYGWAVDMDDGLKASISLKLDGIMTYPT